jgi:hypothetical protein
MQIQGAAMAVIALSAAAAAWSPPPAGPPPGGELITFRTESEYLCGPCEGLTFTAASDGRVWVETSAMKGHDGNWKVRRWRADQTPAQFAALRERLRPLRPAANRDLANECQPYALDARRIEVTWKGGGPDAILDVDFGCDPSAIAAMRQVLLAAPGDLKLRVPASWR